MSILEIYTDGACSGNPGPGGWGFAIYRNGELHGHNYGSESTTTNNAMELTAVIKGLEALVGTVPAVIHTDSKYVVDGINSWIHGWKRNGWLNSQREPVKNADLWKRLDALLTTLRQTTTVDVQWVRGHNGNPGNEEADRLACKGRDEATNPTAKWSIIGSPTTTISAASIRTSNTITCNQRKIAEYNDAGLPELIPLDVDNFRCQLPLSQGVDEPGLRHILEFYYRAHGLNGDTAKATADQYIKALADYSVEPNL